MGRLLSRAELRRLYDRIGARQDRLAFYRGPAVEALCAHGAFEGAASVFELGCGTGQLAARLLREQLPTNARYVGVDLSGRMVQRARNRLAPFGARAAVHQTDGRLAFGQKAHSWERVVTAYVLDLLAPDDIRAFLREAHRLLSSDGRLCLTSLSMGGTRLTRLVSAAWDGLHALRPTWVGGCRPVEVRRFLSANRWSIRRDVEVSAWGIPSTVVVAEPR